MSKLFTGSIDLSKIEKKHIVSADKNGQPFKNNAKYLNISLWINDQVDQYGNSASIQIGGKDEKIYIGNLKEYVKVENAEVINDAKNDDLPF